MKFRQIFSGSLMLLIFCLCNNTYGQAQVKIYDTSLDGMKQVTTAIAKAKSSGRNVFVQYGGNWCPWCRKFDAFCKSDAEISKVMDENYIPVMLNYSPENRNDEANVFLGNPVRFGFPVFIIIDGNGKILHIQDSALLESGEGYDQKKVVNFMKNWTTLAIIPKKK